MNVYKKTWEKWGDLQWLMVIEECSELQKSIVKFLRSRNADREREIAEEIADVEIMIGQLRARSSKFNWLINEFKRTKLNRLKKLLKDERKGYLTFETSWGSVTLKKKKAKAGSHERATDKRDWL